MKLASAILWVGGLVGLAACSSAAHAPPASPASLALPAASAPPVVVPLRPLRPAELPDARAMTGPVFVENSSAVVIEEAFAVC